MNDCSVLVPAIGLGLFCLRLLPWRTLRSAANKPTRAPTSWPRVSIVVPARNEERNIPLLLRSLAQLDYPNYEVVVVDDRSTDRTAAVIAEFGEFADSANVRMVAGVERPTDIRWGGKQWACVQGAAAATGDLLLFTDADTVHEPDSLRRAVAAIQASGAGLLSCLPFHENPQLWERLLGPFQLLILALTAPFAPPKPGRVFVIGQYLLFTREAYEHIGGHTAVASDFAEDLPLANRALRLGLGVEVYRGAPLFHVRMYASLGEFIKGWRRNFRSGFIYASPLAGLDATLMIVGITGGVQFCPKALAIMLLAGLFTSWRQRAIGRFQMIGAFLWPLSLGLFCWATLLAIWDLVFKREMIWKGRSYSPSP